MDNIKILYKYATRGRPQQFLANLKRYQEMMDAAYDYEFLISFDVDDSSMISYEILKVLLDTPHLRFNVAPNKSKIEAINSGMKSIEDWNILVVVSDDMVPQVKGFDTIIVADMLRYFPNFDGALHYNDGYCGQDRTITLSIMGRALYDYFGYIYYPGYKSTHCDNEFTDAVRYLEKHVYIPQVIIKHEWEALTFKSESQNINQKNWAYDNALYLKRKSLGFPPDIL